MCLDLKFNESNHVEIMLIIVDQIMPLEHEECVAKHWKLGLYLDLKLPVTT